MNDGELIKVFMKLKRVHRKRCHDEFRKCDISKGQPKILNYLAEQAVILNLQRLRVFYQLWRKLVLLKEGLIQVIEELLMYI